MAEIIAPTGKLDLSAAPALKADFSSHGGSDITVDLSAVTLFGALCLQCCLAAARRAKATGRTFALINPSDTVLSHMASMGFTPDSIVEGGT